MFEKQRTEFEFLLLMATHDRDVMTSRVASLRQSPSRSWLFPLTFRKEDV
jgi:hypothetical protein